MQSVEKPSQKIPRNRASTDRFFGREYGTPLRAAVPVCLVATLLVVLAACSGHQAEQPTPQPTPSPAPPEKVTTSLVKPAKEALDLLKRFVRQGASDPTNGWAMAHGLLAFGRDLKAADGRLAIDVLVHDFLTVRKEGGKTIYGFPKATPAGEPLATHRHLVVKAMLEAGVPLDRSFPLKSGGSVTLRQIAASAKESLHLPTNEDEWHDFAWSLGAMLDLPPDMAPSGLTDWSRTTLTYTEQQQAFIADLLHRNRPDLLKKERQGIYSHNCGGLHLIQSAVASAVRIGEPARAAQELAIVLFRFKAEKAVYERLIAENPEMKTRLRVQELKFYGHTIETLALANKLGVFPANDKNSQQTAPVAVDLIATIHDLKDAYLAAASLRITDRQVYLDLIGDGCHAIRGLRMSLAADLIP